MRDELRAAFFPCRDRASVTRFRGRATARPAARERGRFRLIPMPMHYQRSFFVLIGLLALACMPGCRHEASPTGIDLLPDSDLAGIEVYDSRGANSDARVSTFILPSVGNTSTFLPLGKTSDYTSRILLRWTGWPVDLASGGRIVSATVTLHASPFSFGQASGPLSFNAHAVRKQWSMYTFTSDSLAALTTDPVPAGQYNGPVGDSIQFQLDSTLIRSWANGESGGQVTGVWGLLLEPTGATNTVYTFDASESSRKPATIRVVVARDGLADTTLVPLQIEDTFIASGPAPAVTELAVHGGLSWRGTVAFDLSAIPPGCIVNAASLRLTIDPSRTRKNIRGIDSVRVYELSDSATRSVGSEYTISTPDSGQRIIAKGLAMTRIVQRWVNHPERNRGFVLVKVEEAGDLDLLAFYGPGAAAELRPRLTVTFTRKP